MKSVPHRVVGSFTAAALVIASTLSTIPVHAAPLDSPPAQAAKQAPDTPQPAASRQDESANRQPVVAVAEQAAQPAESAASGDVDKLDLNYAKTAAVDTGKIFTSPLRWDGGDWLKFGGVAGGTVGLMFLADRGVKSFARNHQNPVASKFAVLGNDLGNGLYTLPAVGAFYLYGYLGDDHKARKTALLALESFAISGILTEGMKELGGRHRPNSGDPPNTWDGPHLGTKNVSFNSGHTASAFSIASVFAEQYKDNPYVAPVAYGLATLTGLSRIYSNEHWLSDTVFGGAIGYFVGKALVKFHQEDRTGILSRISITPQVGKEMNGLTLKCNF